VAASQSMTADGSTPLPAFTICILCKKAVYGLNDPVVASIGPCCCAKYIGKCAYTSRILSCGPWIWTVLAIKLRNSHPGKAGFSLLCPPRSDDKTLKVTVACAAHINQYVRDTAIRTHISRDLDTMCGCAIVPCRTSGFLRASGAGHERSIVFVLSHE
jgi:hypothetical protein